jgi:hypothetical protein
MSADFSFNMVTAEAPVLQSASALKDCAIEARDGRMGMVNDLLFDDHTWKLRWVVVETGDWLAGRKVRIHPSSIGSVDHERRILPVALTMEQAKGCARRGKRDPASQRMESHLFNYRGWDPYWALNCFGMGALASRLSAPHFDSAESREVVCHEVIPGSRDHDLRSMSAVISYRVHASDGEIGHVENFLVDDETWEIRYLVVDPGHWWPGTHVLVSPDAVREIDWTAHAIHLDVTRARVGKSPLWDPAID